MNQPPPKPATNAEKSAAYEWLRQLARNAPTNIVRHIFVLCSELQKVALVPEPEVCGWRPIENQFGQFWISECGEDWAGKFGNYCPGCGRRVDVKEEQA